MDQPQLWLIAGPNGAGKSTLVQNKGLSERIPVINPDNIAKHLKSNEPRPAGQVIQAGKEALRQRNALLAKGESFAIETTLSGKGELDFMRVAKEKGYKVTLVYIGVNRPYQSILRVKSRVEVGGHNVPQEDIARRFSRSMENLPEAMRIADRTFVLDNSKDRHRLIYSMESGREKFVASRVPEWIKNYCHELHQTLSRGPGLER